MRSLLQWLKPQAFETTLIQHFTPTATSTAVAAAAAADLETHRQTHRPTVSLFHPTSAPGLGTQLLHTIRNRLAKKTPHFEAKAFVNRYGQLVTAEKQQASHEREDATGQLESNIRLIIEHALICNGLLSSNYHVDIQALTSQEAGYSLVIYIPSDFGLTHHRRFKVEDLVCLNALQKLKVEILSIEWRLDD